MLAVKLNYLFSPLDERVRYSCFLWRMSFHCLFVCFCFCFSFAMGSKQSILHDAVELLEYHRSFCGVSLIEEFMWYQPARDAQV